MDTGKDRQNKPIEEMNIFKEMLREELVEEVRRTGKQLHAQRWVKIIWGPRAMLLIHECVSESQGWFVKTQIAGPHPRISDSIGLE